MGDGPARPNPDDLDAHDVLAAEEFALPAPDPSIGHPPVVLPDDPSGTSEPHDVLAAEAFALPASAPHPHGAAGGPSRGAARPAVVLLGAAGLLIVSWVVRRRGR